MIEGRVGYGTNPFLNRDSSAGSPFVGFTVSPTLRWRNPTNITELTGSYSRDQYFSRFGHTDDAAVDLHRNQTLSSKLSASAHVGYFTSVSGLFAPYFNNLLITPGAVDQLAVGTRQSRITGDAGLNWQPTEHDAYQLSALGARQTYRRFGGDFDYVAVTGAYLRTLDAKTKVGLRLTASKTYSNDYPDSSSLQPQVTLDRKLSAHWTLSGGVGAIIERERFTGRSRTRVTPGFDASLCATYPRYDLCLSGSRTAAASGLGGLRNQTQVSVNGTYRLNERSRLIGLAGYGISDSEDQVLIDGIRYGDQRFSFARLDYKRDISRRFAVGAGLSYQGRSGAGLPEVHALAINFNLSRSFGHLS